MEHVHQCSEPAVSCGEKFNGDSESKIMFSDDWRALASIGSSLVVIGMHLL